MDDKGSLLSRVWGRAEGSTGFCGSLDESRRYLHGRGRFLGLTTRTAHIHQTLEKYKAAFSTRLNLKKVQVG